MMIALPRTEVDGALKREGEVRRKDGGDHAEGAVVSEEGACADGETGKLRRGRCAGPGAEGWGPAAGGGLGAAAGCVGGLLGAASGRG